MIRAGLVWLLVPGVVSAESLPALFDVTGVGATEMVDLRAQAQVSAVVIGQVAPDARGIEVVGLSPDGAWAMVNSGEQVGYAGRRYLVRQTTSDWFTLQVPLHCIGTEPFWALTYDPAQPVAEFSTPDGTAPFELTTRWSGTVDRPTAAMAMGDRRFAALRAEACSDGMSNRVFGISASLFMIGGTGSATLWGCCSLHP